MDWIKKNVKENSLEIENLMYLLSLNIKIIPSIKEITNDCYYIEKCNKVIDFNPADFGMLFVNLEKHLYKFKTSSFTAGIYKYFEPNSINCIIENRKYVSYLMDMFEKIIYDMFRLVPLLSKELQLIALLELLREKSVYIRNWEPNDGFSLLHGDLHLFNIVKRNEDYLLIDFEYLRYGSVELEISNFLLSIFIFYYKKNPKEKIDILEYLFIGNPSALDNRVFPFFFTYALCLFYLTFSINNDTMSLIAIRKIIENYLIDKRTLIF